VWCHNPDPPYSRREGTVERVKHLPAGSVVVTVKLDGGNSVALSPHTVHNLDVPPPIRGCHYCASVEEQADEPDKPGPLEEELRRLTGN